MLRDAWLKIQRSRRAVRWPLKWAFVLIITFVTLFPYPSYCVRNIRHWNNLEAMIQPDSPVLAPWAQELDTHMPAGATDAQRMRIIEQFVYQKVPYAFDWDNWGVVDYLPTLEEIVQQGREDCDGQALVAASLLRRYDTSAEMVTDTAHVWVKSAAGESMSPGGAKVLESTPTGLIINWRNLLDISKPAIALSLFPLRRELIILAAVLLALADPRMRGWTAFGAALLMLHGLLVIKLAASNVWVVPNWGVWLGFAQMLAGVLIPTIAARRVMRRSIYR